MESFSTYVNLRFPHITVKPGQNWKFTKGTYTFICRYHGEFQEQGSRMMRGNKSRCPGCEPQETNDTQIRKIVIEVLEEMLDTLKTNYD